MLCRQERHDANDTQKDEYAYEDCTEKLPPPLDRAIEMILDKLEPDVLLYLVPFLKKISEKGPLKVATACSGCDVIIICMQRLFMAMQGRWDANVEIQHLFAVERDAQKNAFLAKQFDGSLEMLLTDVGELHMNTVHNTLNGKETILPRASLSSTGNRIPWTMDQNAFTETR